jgi:hypothetical protein
MVLATLLLCVFSLALLSYGRQGASDDYNPSDPLRTCDQIAAAISGVSRVFFPCERVIPPFVMLRADDGSSFNLLLIRHFACFSFEH